MEKDSLLAAMVSGLSQSKCRNHTVLHLEREGDINWINNKIDIMAGVKQIKYSKKREYNINEELHNLYFSYKTI